MATSSHNRMIKGTCVIFVSFDLQKDHEATDFGIWYTKNKMSNMLKSMTYQKIRERLEVVPELGLKN